jgi:hypothetical protein
VERVLNRDTDTDQSRPAYERVNVLISELDRLRAENAELAEQVKTLEGNLDAIAETFNQPPYYPEPVDLSESEPVGGSKSAWNALWIVRGVAEGAPYVYEQNARYVEALEDLIYQVEHTKGTDVICLEQAKAALTGGGE